MSFFLSRYLQSVYLKPIITTFTEESNELVEISMRGELGTLMTNDISSTYFLPEVPVKARLQESITDNIVTFIPVNVYNRLTQTERQKITLSGFTIFSNLKKVGKSGFNTVLLAHLTLNPENTAQKI